MRSEAPTLWLPGSKPIWFTELGCAAVDKATNQPNKFLDAKSSESSLPKFSNGRRDDYIQRQYLRAMYEYWGGDPANNITDVETGVQMVDMSRAMSGPGMRDLSPPGSPPAISNCGAMGG